MIRDPKDLQRYTASERANHWVVGICFILLALSGLAFFHPAFFPLSQFFGGPVWARILHPFIGVVLTISFLGLFFRFWKLNRIGAADREWLSRVGEMVNGDDHGMPEQGKYNGGQKVMFWALAVCVLLLFVSGILLWRAYFSFPVDAVRLGAVVHAAAAALMIGFILVHVYAAIWVKGTIRAMWYGTVTRAWAKQHHRGWYRQVTGK
ncbi:formate dehydrogenase subunit gamma [Pseudothauera rhizosphaerae]|uniref:Formate dehydrogenase subunit gamma n=1 Tax=Pseudothauera rhizosphaerae TaxID=2565932 RepID=A0A4S4B2T5_9RHOO|nr:formate dehydrogenase subunit gamma [Pseudothauera rhizosphaerae]THF65221.1 formate dehydrogenase subunit gamma [Pseudothauera rhizosphaerae]